MAEKVWWREGSAHGSRSVGGVCSHGGLQELDRNQELGGFQRPIIVTALLTERFHLYCIALQTGTTNEGPSVQNMSLRGLSQVQANLKAVASKSRGV